MKKLIPQLVIVLLCGLGTHAMANLKNTLINPLPSTPGDATELTQLLNLGQLTAMVEKQVKQFDKQVEQLENEVNMYNKMIQNTLNIAEQKWTEIAKDIQTVSDIVQQGVSISFAGITIDSDFKIKYPAYEQFKQQLHDYRDAYKDWAQSSMDGLRAALDAAGLQAQDFSTEGNVLDQLRSMSKSAAGRMQALQVGTQVAVEQVAQLQKLRQLVMSQIQAQSNYLAAERSEKDAQEVQVSKLLEYIPRPKIEFKYFSGGAEQSS